MSKLAKALLASATKRVAMEQAREAEVARETEAAQLATAAVTLRDQVDEVQAINEVAALAEAAADARDAKEVVSEVREVEGQVEEVREVVEAVNDNGGISQESLGFLMLAMNAHTTRIGMEPVNLGPSLESFTPELPKQRVALENIDALLATIQAGGEDLEKRSIEATNRLVAALVEALPAAKSRLAQVTSAAGSRNDKPAAAVDVGDILNVLGVDGAIPNDLVRFFNLYTSYGKALVGDYSNAAFTAATEAASFPTSLSFETTDSFWNSVLEKIQLIGDPRTKLTDDQKDFSLPACGPLFSGAEATYGGTNEAIKALTEFTANRAPLDPSDVSDQTEPPAPEVPEGGESTSTAAALMPTDIKTIGDALYALYEKMDLSAYANQGSSIWPSAMAAVRASQEVLGQTTDQMRSDLGVDADLIPAYLDTVYNLSAWPVLHFLTNLVFTTNGFVLYAERSLAADEPPVEPEVPGADPALVDPNAALDPTDPAADPAAADPATDIAAAVDAVVPTDGEPAAPAGDLPPDIDPEAAPPADDAVPPADDELPSAGEEGGETPPADDTVPPTEDEPPAGDEATPPDEDTTNDLDQHLERVAEGEEEGRETEERRPEERRDDKTE